MEAITAEELHINNLVIVNHKTDKVAIVDSICRNSIEARFIDGMAEDMATGMIVSPEKTYGIPLSEEWLKRFGFEKSMCDGTALFDLKKENLPLFFNGDKNGFMEVVLDIEPQVRIKHVHQLQNLHFALSGQELTLKE